jgi:hypothetical protein
MIQRTEGLHKFPAILSQNFHSLNIKLIAKVIKTTNNSYLPSQLSKTFISELWRAFETFSKTFSKLLQISPQQLRGQIVKVFLRFET